MKILDYSSWIHRSRSILKKDLLGVETPPIVKEEGICPYCRVDAHLCLFEKRIEKYSPNTPKSHIKKITDKNRTSLDQFIDVIGRSTYDLHVYQCLSCGWWEVGVTNSDSAGEEGSLNEANYRAVLKAYDPGDIGLPIQALRRELLLKNDVIHKIHDKKMEQLVASVMKDFYPGVKSICAEKRGMGELTL